MILVGELKSKQYYRKEARTDLRYSGKVICKEVLARHMKGIMIKYSKIRKANLAKSVFIQRTFFLFMCFLRDGGFPGRHSHERKTAVITVKGCWMHMSDGYTSPLVPAAFTNSTTPILERALPVLAPNGFCRQTAKEMERNTIEVNIKFEKG